MNYQNRGLCYLLLSVICLRLFGVSFCHFFFTSIFQMFCTACGNKINAGQCFCGVCGEKCPPSRVNLTALLNENKSEPPTFKEFMERKNSQAQDIAKVKADERKGRFTSSKKKRGAVEMVKVCAGT